jgi:hypothetical protein
MKKNSILLSCMVLVLSFFFSPISQAKEEFFYDIELKKSYPLFSKQNLKDMKIKFIIKDTEADNTYFIESKVLYKVLPTKLDEKHNWEYFPPLHNEDNKNMSTYKFVEDDHYDKKVSFYNADTLNLVSTKIFSQKHGTKHEIYQAIIRKGTDDFSNAEINEVYTKEYIRPDKGSGRDGHYREQVMELMSDDMALDTYGFVFYLYKKKSLKEKTSFYYVDKGFVRKVFIKSERQSFVNYKNKKSSCRVYEIIYKSPPALFSVYIEETEERLPLKIEFSKFSLVLSEGKTESNPENREEK